MQIAQLELFAAVVELGGITVAGDALGLSQPAASRSLRAFERELGLKLLERDGRTVAVTDAGAIAYEAIASMLGDWQGLQADLRRIGGRPDRVTLAVPFGTARVAIPVLVRRAAETMADVTVNVVEQSSPQALEAVENHDYAMALVYPEAGHTGVTRIASEQLCAVGAPDVLGSDRQPIDLRAVAKLPLLLSERTWSIRRIIDDVFAAESLTPNVVREVGIADALMAFAIEGDGVTILPTSNVVREHELGTLAVRPIVNPTIDRWLALATDVDLPPAFAAELGTLFVDSLREVAETAGWSTLTGSSG